MMVSKSNNLGQRDITVPRLNSTNFADGSNRAFRLNHQPNQLHHSATSLSDARLLHSPERALQTIGRTCMDRSHWWRVCLSCSIFVSRRASTSPKRVWTRQPPRVTSEELTNRSCPASALPL